MPSRCFGRQSRDLGASLLAIGLVFATGSMHAQSQGADVEPDGGWPRTVVRPEATVVMYEPQISRFTLNEVEARAAVQVSTPGVKEPAFGAVWITARVETDRDTRLVTFSDIKIPKVRFADASQADQDKLARLLEREMPQWQIEIALDRLIPLLELAEHEDPREAGIKNDPPAILVSSEPATLVVIDGEARRQPITAPAAAAQRKLERVINTPVLLVFDPEGNTYYLAGGGDLWYSASDVLGPYAVATQVPSAVRELAAGGAEKAQESEGAPPKVVVATQATELIVVGGQPKYAPLGDVDLLVVSNADRDVLVPMASREHFVLLSGRWYASGKGLDGPWRFVPPADLPAAFSRIPPDSEWAHLRAHVPGTAEAREALLDNLIPQTTAIRRDEASLAVEYDGPPRFEDVEGVPIQYAVNSPRSVFKVGERYYACDQGVWYESAAATGPWAVAVSVPRQIYDIPPSNPHYNVTYVRVYDVTPQVVYVGYTPGYVGSYVYGGCVVYGTGWRYPAWWGSVYYPRPSTWGFHATYSPWYGWGFGISWSSGPLTVSIGTGGWGYPHHSWWGPWGWRPYYPPHRPPYYPGYRPPYYPGYRPPNYPSHHRPPASRPPVATPRPGTPAQLPSAAGRQPGGNLYRRDGNASRNAPRPAQLPAQQPTAARSRPNNVYSDRDGNVFRSGSGGSWDRRQGGGWQPAKPDGGTTQQPRPGTSDRSLNQDRGARERGQTRTRSAPRPSPQAGAGRRR